MIIYQALLLSVVFGSIAALVGLCIVLEMFVELDILMRWIFLLAIIAMQVCWIVAGYNLNILTWAGS